MIFSPQFNGIFTLDEHERHREALRTMIHDMCWHVNKVETALHISLDFLRNREEIHTYFTEIFAWYIKNGTTYNKEVLSIELINSRQIFVRSKDKNKIKWAQYSVYNTLMEKCEIIKNDKYYEFEIKSWI